MFLWVCFSSDPRKVCTFQTRCHFLRKWCTDTTNSTLWGLWKLQILRFAASQRHSPQFRASDITNFTIWQAISPHLVASNFAPFHGKQFRPISWQAISRDFQYRTMLPEPLELWPATPKPTYQHCTSVSRRNRDFHTASTSRQFGLGGMRVAFSIRRY